MALRGLLWM